MDWLDAHGLSSFMMYREKLRAGLEEFLRKVAAHCKALPDFAEGMTFVIMGGLGRGFALGFEEWSDEWRLSVIRISDLLMLAREHDRHKEDLPLPLKEIFVVNLAVDHALLDNWEQAAAYANRVPPPSPGLWLFLAVLFRWWLVVEALLREESPARAGKSVRQLRVLAGTGPRARLPRSGSQAVLAR
jgi:hypothetical protein